MPLAALPPGFTVVREAGLRAALAPGLAAPARAAGLLDPARLAERLAAGGGEPGRGPTALVSLADRSERLLLRPLRHGGLLGPLLGGLLPGAGRPLRELATTAALRRAGAPVPRPALVLAWRRAGPLWHAVVGTFFEEGALDALAFLAGAPCGPRLRAAASATGRALRRFHDAGGEHADLHLKNLLLRERPAGFEAIVVDLDRARIRPDVDAASRMAQLMRLYRSALKRRVLRELGPRTAVRLLHAYLAGDRALRRAMLGHLARERRRVALHALLYRRS